MNDTANNNKNLYYQVALSSLLWGVIVIPVLTEHFWNFPYSVFSCILGVICALGATIFPMKFGKNWPPKNKEYHVLFYPVITIPLALIGDAIRRSMF
jgi:hypothetical protein